MGSREFAVDLKLAPIDLLLPVKQLSAAKSRLEKSELERREVMLSYLAHVANVSLESLPSLHCWIVSPVDLRPEITSDGPQSYHRLHWIQEVEPRGLNQALEMARLQVKEHRGRVASTIGVLLPDLPGLTVEEMRQFLALHELSLPPMVTLACDRHGRGTNGLLLGSETDFAYRFGVDSFLLHKAQAWARQQRIKVFRSAGTANDVDVPADLDG